MSWTLLFVGLDLAALIDYLTSESSTAALLFLTPPVILLGVALGAAVLPALERVRRRVKIQS